MFIGGYVGTNGAFFLTRPSPSDDFPNEHFLRPGLYQLQQHQHEGGNVVELVCKQRVCRKTRRHAARTHPLLAVIGQNLRLFYRTCKEDGTDVIAGLSLAWLMNHWHRAPGLVVIPCLGHPMG